MKKRVALKILKYKDKLRYKPSQIEEARRVAARYGIQVEGNSAEEEAEQQPEQEKAE